MQDFLFFLGRFHVLALHLPVGIVVVAVVLDFVSRRERYRALAKVSPFLWGAAALSAVLTAGLGYLHFAEGSFAGPSASAHRLYGTVTAIATVLVWWLSRGRTVPAGGVRLAAGIVVLLLVTVTGHYGGNLTHGETFLIEYAPAPLRALVGAGERRAAPTSVAMADPYLDVVRPLLEQRCGTCHNGDKHNGSFSMASYQSTLAGGDTARAVVPGDAQASELFYRISLPRDDESFMPAEGKTPLTSGEIEIIRWWIAAGAPHDVTVGALGVDVSVEPLLAARLGLENGAAPATPPAAAADPALVARLFEAGFLVRQVSQQDPHLVVSVNSPGTALGEAATAVLAEAAAQIVDLNLQNADLDDDRLAAIGALPVLARLRLSGNRITDRGLSVLERMPELRYLNLYGNAGVTDAGLEPLAQAATLQELYLWQTGVSAEGVARLRSRRPGLTVLLGASSEIETVGASTGAGQ